MTRFALDFEWRGFELHPEIPTGGLDIGTMFPPQQVAAMHARLKQVADDFGVPFHPQAHAPSTKPALALSAWAREQDRLDPWREAAMNAYWRDGKDLEDRGVLRALLTEAGLDADAGLAFLDEPSVPKLLQDQRMEAMRWGVTGIPTWFLLPADWKIGDPLPPEDAPRPVRIVGCQPPEVLERAARIAGAAER